MPVTKACTASGKFTKGFTKSKSHFAFIHIPMQLFHLSTFALFSAK